MPSFLPYLLEVGIPTAFVILLAMSLIAGIRDWFRGKRLQLLAQDVATHGISTLETDLQKCEICACKSYLHLWEYGVDPTRKHVLLCWTCAARTQRYFPAYRPHPIQGEHTYEATPQHPTPYRTKQR